MSAKSILSRMLSLIRVESTRVRSGQQRTNLNLENLGDRVMPAGFATATAIQVSSGGTAAPPAVVKADLAQLHADQQKLQSDLVSLAPTLKADHQAVHSAIQSAYANDATVQSALQTLKTELASWKAQHAADLHTVQTAKSPAARAAAIAKLHSDHAAAAQAISTDLQALHTAVNADAGVAAAIAKLATDAAPIKADRAAIQADQEQLWADS